MSCCSAKGCNEFFTDRVAGRDADRYRRKGLDKNAQRLVEVVLRHGIEGRSVLEVGGGIGAIQLELLQAGAAHAENIELSPAYEPYAAELLGESAFAGRAERRLLDFADTAEHVDPADVVVLHKVVCCYPDYEALVGAAAVRAKRQLVLTYPRRSWWTRLGFTAANLLERLRRRTFRAYVHPPAAIIAIARAQGLEPTSSHRGPLWELCGLERTDPPADIPA
jgi:hypothetical protein